MVEEKVAFGRRNELRRRRREAAPRVATLGIAGPRPPPGLDTNDKSFRPESPLLEEEVGCRARVGAVAGILAHCQPVHKPGGSWVR